jgi:hypothetical protein
MQLFAIPEAAVVQYGRYFKDTKKEKIVSAREYINIYISWWF